MEYNPSISFHYEATQTDIDFLWEGIIDYNKTIGPMLEFPPYKPYRIVLKDEEKQILAGILTKIYLQCMAVELLWVRPGMRDKGIGSELLKRVEEHARSQRCTFIHLDTFSFQAIDFYQKHGYSIFATIDSYPGEVKRYYLKKDL